jgi:hypothetical protein
VAERRGGGTGCNVRANMKGFKYLLQNDIMKQVKSYMYALQRSCLRFQKAFFAGIPCGLRTILYLFEFYNRCAVSAFRPLERCYTLKVHLHPNRYRHLKEHYVHVVFTESETTVKLDTGLSYQQQLEKVIHVCFWLGFSNI